MSDPLVIQTLKQKRAEISGVIAAYQAKIAQARHDLAHINAVIRLAQARGVGYAAPQLGRLQSCSVAAPCRAAQACHHGHGKRGLSKLLFGREAIRVLTGAHVPVLICR